MTDAILILKIVSAATWLANLTMLVGPCWRILRRRRRYLVPFWAIVLLGVLNRLMFVSGQVPPAISYIAAILLAVLLFIAMRSYQRDDR